MDPRMLTAFEWAATVPMLVSLWSFAGTMVVFAFSLMLGHAVIPSLIGTRHLPERAASWRLPLYGIAVLFFVISAGIFLNFALNLVGPIYGVYPRVWY